MRSSVLTAFERAVNVLQENSDVLHESARQLLEKETLDTPDLERIFAEIKPAPAEIARATPPCG